MDKTNLNSNWQRIASVIRWSNMTINHFAKHIGLSRAENLYQIKNGNNGISQKLAHRIVEAFPAISIGWLLSGEGVMLCEDNDTSLIPCFCDIERFLSYCQDKQTAPDSVVNFLPAADAEVAVVVDNAARWVDFCSTDDNVASKKCFFLKKIATFFKKAAFFSFISVLVCPKDSFFVFKLYILPLFSLYSKPPLIHPLTASFPSFLQLLFE